ncbi:hypothetical protein [Alysiella filiformis]|uniref:Uncharacterized protein n=1 Tax=Alysiella filiformis DSM 16848 TaxID=1120981 RepID=A0A286E6X9_9NEIS|nr:hypothetical protein [Alysiella filiformis]QMT31546.1 hypothetical protein H3L97_01145 [Alysiella filiformis]UBQ55441.1 hypothetical protein JF568_07530 [Alysiella filiformis DSM 16848]SOD66662.1 hypothetical protein SAMN02746062_00684 [Alysiella filiformis DSM 16848]
MNEFWETFKTVLVCLIPIYAFWHLLTVYFKTRNGAQPLSPVGALLVGNPEVKMWLEQNLTGERIADIKAIRQQWGLDLTLAVEVLDAYFLQKTN